MPNEKGLAVGVVVAIVIAIAALGIAVTHGGSSQKGLTVGSSVNGGNVTDYTALNTDAGYWVGGVKVVGSSGILAASLAQLDAGLLLSYANSTSTTLTSYTMVQADILSYDTVLMTPNVGALTVTFPASSTLTSFVPNAGDTQRQCWVNSTSTSAITITFAGGTGVNLQVASSTTNIGLPAIQPRGTACFTFIRDKNTDINAAFIRYVDGD